MEPVKSIPVEALRELLGERSSDSQALRDQHGQDESFHPCQPPDLVVFPETNEEVSQILAICTAHRCPVIPFGAGTSLEGHVAAIRGGVSLDLTRMNEIIEVNPQDLDCRVQAGVTRLQLERRLRYEGLFFAIDPGADATIGGMAATRASGTNAVRYGTMRENVMGLTVVLCDGRIVRTGGRARKSSSGYDLTRLMVGSEGTLGVITEVQLRLHGVPEAVSAAVCSFENIEFAVATAIQVVQLGLSVSRMELLDEIQMDAVNRYSKTGYPVKPTLFFEFHGSPAGVRECADEVSAIAAEQGGADFRWAVNSEERHQLWQARHDAFYAALALRPGSKGWPTDVCVPISELPQCILETKRDVAEAELLAPLVGHVGDGNFHLVFIFDPGDEAEVAKIERVNRRMVERAIGCGGTCSGEHGVGYGKIPFLELEHGPALAVMRSIKRALDPHNLMNPGKIVIP